MLRVVTIAPACLSIVAVPSTFIWWWYFHKSREAKFRHVLIWALLIADLLKAIVMIIHPIAYLHSNMDFDLEIRGPFCDGIGFLTVLTSEIADFAVLLLAIHTALLVFSPRCSRGQGLYRFRYSVGSIFLFIPLIFSIVSLIPLSSTIPSGFAFLSSWCYLRVYPIWYR